MLELQTTLFDDIGLMFSFNSSDTTQFNNLYPVVVVSSSIVMVLDTSVVMWFPSNLYVLLLGFDVGAVEEM